MLRIYDDVRLLQDDARVLCVAIAAHDLGLAAQLRRSAQSVALNVAEGMGASGGHRRNAYATALREARECAAAIDVAEQWGYLARAKPDVLDRLDKIRATLFKLAMPRRR
jgi:four helix bundle protein